MTDNSPLEVTPVPSDLAPNTAAPKRRGRPKGSTSTRSKKSDVDSALATMSTLYTAISAGILMTGRTQTAMVIASRVEDVQAANRSAFEASPKLAHMIAMAGQVSGVAMFISANLTLAVTIMGSYRAESIAIHSHE